ncbi:MAG: ribosome assembly cofactor RimP [Chitinophagales bacterium]
MQELIDKIEKWATPKLEEEGLFLVDIVVSTSHKIQVFVDADDKVHIDKCVAVSRYLEKYLDEDDVVPEKYTLEVSSAGMSNPLKLPRQYKKRIGQLFKITFWDGDVIGAKLLEVDEEQIVVNQTTLPEKGKKGQRPKKKVKEEDNILTIAYKDIKKAILHINF